MINLALDDEENLIKEIQRHLNQKDTYLYHGNSFEHKIMHCIQDSNNLISHNKHDDPPPDFLSPKYNMMFDIMRVNDTEISKHYNPVKQRERNMIKDLNKLEFLNKVSPDTKLYVSSESADTSEHSFINYKKNVQRVTKDHLISKGHQSKVKELWIPQNQNIKYKGFVIFDETECCFDGNITYAGNNKFMFSCRTDKPLILHEPWNDKDFIQWAYDSELDFVVWACCYKPFGTIPMTFHLSFPFIMIIDVRYPRTELYIDYSNNNLVL